LAFIFLCLPWNWQIPHMVHWWYMNIYKVRYGDVSEIMVRTAIC
jgi:hypothetical protein